MPTPKRPLKVTDLICDALCRLIESGRTYSDISIQEIVEEAGTCRNSFYRNYKVKDDILKDRFFKICAESDRLCAKATELFDLVYSISSTCKKHRDFLMCFYHANSMMYLSTVTTRIITTNTTKSICEVSPTDYYTYASRAWLATGILTEWMIRNCDLSVEELTRFITDKLS